MEAAPETIYRLAVVRRSRYVGAAVLAGAKLVAVRARRIPPRDRKQLRKFILQLGTDQAVDEVVIEHCDRPTLATECLPWPSTTASRCEVAEHILKGQRRPTRRDLMAEVCRRYPELRRCRGRALSRDRTVILFAVALALAVALRLTAPILNI